LQSQLDDDAAQLAIQSRHRLRDAFTSGRLWLLCLLYFLLNVGGYGYEFWLPTIIQEFSGQGEFVVGLIGAIPYCAAAVVMVLVGRHSDRTGERRWHVAAAAMTSAAGFVLSVWFQNPIVAVAALTLAFVGLKSTLGPFWALGTTFLSGTAAAGGIAWINSVGNLGGFVGPTVVGAIQDATGSNVTALLALGSALLAMGLLALVGTRASPVRVRP
jgi:nitrate/nitrite transporter NarK